MFTDIDDVQFKSELNSCITFVNLYQKQMMMMEYYDEITDMEVFQETITPDMIENASTSKMNTVEAKGAVGRFFERIWNAIKKFFTMIKNFFAKLFKKTNSSKVGKAANEVGNFFENAPQEEIDALVETAEEELDDSDDSSSSDDNTEDSSASDDSNDDTPVSEMYIGEAVNEVKNLPKNTPKDDKAYLKKALYVMKTQKGYMLSKIHSKQYMSLATKMVSLLNTYANRINGAAQNKDVIDLNGLNIDSKKYRAQITALSVAFAGATRFGGGDIVKLSEYEERYKRLMTANAEISKSFNSLEKAMDKVKKNIDKFTNDVNKANDESKYGKDFVNKKYKNLTKSLGDLYTNISNMMKDLTKTITETIAGALKSELDTLLRIRGIIIETKQKPKSTGRKRRSAPVEEEEEEEEQDDAEDEQEPHPRQQSQNRRKKKKTSNSSEKSSAPTPTPTQQTHQDIAPPPRQSGHRGLNFSRPTTPPHILKGARGKEFTFEGKTFTIDDEGRPTGTFFLYAKNGPMSTFKNLDGSDVNDLSAYYVWSDGVLRSADGAAYHMNGEFWPERSVGKNKPQ